MSMLLVSGGLDSAVATAWALKNLEEEGGKHIPLSFFYGQRHSVERKYAERLCQHFDLPSPQNLNLAQVFAVIGGSSLTSGLVHGNPSEEQVARTESELPPTFVPGRNIAFLTIAASLGYVEKIYSITGGWNVLDYSGYPDCRGEFFQSLATTLDLGLGLPIDTVKIYHPLLDLTKVEIIKLGLELKVPFELTWSCYSGGHVPCEVCDSCKIRSQAFADLQMTDPLLDSL